MTRSELIEAAARIEFMGADTPFLRRVAQGVANAIAEEIEGKPDDRGQWPRSFVWGPSVTRIRETFANLARIEATFG